MWDEHMQGWYTHDATVHISADAARDGALLRSVYWHEGTHHYLGTTTTFGYLESLVSRHTTHEARRDENLLLIEGLLNQSARLPHEAAATYCGLLSLCNEPDDIDVAQLPTEYRDGVQKLIDLFIGSQLTREYRFWSSRIIASYALDTTILFDWLALGLNEAVALYEYLNAEANRPETRFEKLCFDLRPTDDSFDLQLQEYLRASSSNTLNRIRIADLPVSKRSVWRDLAYIQQRIDATLSMTRLHPISSRRAQLPQVVLEPAQYSWYRSPLESIDREWIGNADYVEVERNTGDTGVGRPPHRIGPHEAYLEFRRADEANGRRCFVSNAELPSVLNSFDPVRAATVVVNGQMSINPENLPEDWVPQLIDIAPPYSFHATNAQCLLGDLGAWTSERGVILNSSGSLDSLAFWMAVIDAAIGELAQAVWEIGTHSLIVFIVPAQGSTIIAHPTLKVEWSRNLKQIMAWNSVDVARDNRLSSTYERWGTHMARFVRAFTAAEVSPDARRTALVSTAGLELVGYDATETLSNTEEWIDGPAKPLQFR